MTALAHRSLWTDAIAARPPIHLDELTAAVETTEARGHGRFDRKYLIRLDRLGELSAGLGRRWRVLEVGGQRTTRYTTRYFDTADLATFRQHRQGRRRRYKIRIRRYGDAPDAVLEIKYRGHRNRTIKARRTIEHDGRDLDGRDLDDWVMQPGSPAMQFVTETLRAAYAIEAPDTLAPSITTAYDRTTFVDSGTGERLTVDLGLVVSPSTAAASVQLGSRFAIVETKSPMARTSIHRHLSAVGARPERLSKYCLGVGATCPDIAANPWQPALARLRPAPVSDAHRVASAPL